MARKSNGIVVLALLFLASACTGKDDKVVAKVNGKKVTAGEVTFFVQELSRGGRQVDDQVKKRILDQLIVKSLLLEEAERLGITKNERLLRKVERERERIILDELTRREVDMFVMVTEEEIQQLYENYAKQQGKKAEPLESVKKQIHAQLAAKKKREAFDTLVTNLRGKAKIDIDEAVLKMALSQGPARPAP